ncbi:YadA-like family protein [Candidatus Arsenophonus nilaparvatae]|uniref:YadA-like family protein n=1 Tax=Candidatus Arsenophonus nilaparvatae TaxID=1247023 RepID=UPI003877DB02
MNKKTILACAIMGILENVNAEEVKTEGEFSTVLGTKAQASGYASTAIGAESKATGEFSSALGTRAEASGYLSTAIGEESKATGEFSSALGLKAEASRYASTAIGEESKATGEFSSALGLKAEASGYASTAIGKESKATCKFSSALGTKAEASRYASTAIGGGSKATGKFSSALGTKAEASRYGSTAIGASSKAKREYTENLIDMVRNQLNDPDKNALITELSVGYIVQEDKKSGTAGVKKFSQITHVAPGTEDTDVVNLYQMNSAIEKKLSDTRINHLEDKLSETNTKIERGLATSAALTGLFQPYGVGKVNFTASIGGYGASQALAVGTGYRITENAAVKAGVAYSGGNHVMYNASFNFEW